MTDLFNELNEVINKQLFKEMNMTKEKKPVNLGWVRLLLANEIYENTESQSFAATGEIQKAWHEGVVEGLKIAMKAIGEEDED